MRVDQLVNNAGKKDSATALSPADVARAGFEGMQRGELVIFPGIVFKMEKTALGLLPPELQVALIARWQQGLIAAKA